jgi:hypothetical protein
MPCNGKHANGTSVFNVDFFTLFDGPLYLRVVGLRGRKWSWHILKYPPFAYYANHSTFDKERRPNNALFLDKAQNTFKLYTLLNVQLVYEDY